MLSYLTATKRRSVLTYSLLQALMLVIFLLASTSTQAGNTYKDSTVLVWVLVISSWQSSRDEVEQLGPYATKEDCDKIQQSKPLKPFTSECLQINIVLR